jgi:protein TonB
VSEKFAKAALRRGLFSLGGEVWLILFWCPLLQQHFTQEDTMFADSLLETSWAQRSRRSWTTITSFGLQAVLMAALLVLPLIQPVGLPFMKPLATPVSLAPPPGPPPSQPPKTPTRPSESNLSQGVLIMPREIPKDISMRHDESEPVQSGPAGPYVPGGLGSGDPNGVYRSLGTAANPVMPLPPLPAVTRPIRVSDMSEGMLVHRVQPVYPAPAKFAHVQGKVVLSAIISREGTIENLRVLAGQPMLVRAAIDAVSQWRYRPYILNHEPVEVETQVTVNFVLSGS